MSQLVDQDWCSPFAQKQQGEACCQDLVAFDQWALKEPRYLDVLLDQFLGAQAVPIVLAEEPQSREVSRGSRP